MPIEQPTKFELTINLKTARTINLAVPELFISRADEISSDRFHPPEPSVSTKVAFRARLLPPSAAGKVRSAFSEQTFVGGRENGEMRRIPTVRGATIIRLEFDPDRTLLDYHSGATGSHYAGNRPQYNTREGKAVGRVLTGVFSGSRHQRRSLATRP